MQQVRSQPLCFCCVNFLRQRLKPRPQNFPPGFHHQVAARIILLLLDFGADIKYEQERNLRSWYEGSIIAIAIQIAISCGSPIELTHPSVGDDDGKNDGNSNKENFRGHRVKERQQEPDNDSFDGNKEFTHGIIQLEQHIPTLETPKSR